MSWLTIIWSMTMGACAATALPHLIVGLRRRAWENLFFALAALAVVGVAWGELAILHSHSIEEIGRAQQLTHLPIFLLVVAIVGFIHFSFGTAKSWLGLAAVGVRLLSLVINFAAPPNVNFRQVTSLRPLHFLGEDVSMPEGILSPWTRLGELSAILLVVYVVDASIQLWRRGDREARQRALVIGGTVTLFLLMAPGVSALVHARLVELPYLISFPFLAVIIGMGIELGWDILRAAQTTRQLRTSEGALRESEEQMSLAAKAANLGLWVWNIARDEIWMTERGRELFGIGQNDPINYARFLAALAVEDRGRMKEQVARAVARGGHFESEYRVARKDGQTEWVAGHGRVECDQEGKPAFMRGVIRDITKRKLAEEALRESEARFRTVADAAPVMIWMAGPDKQCNFFSKGWLEFTGRTLGDELNDGWVEGVQAEDLVPSRAVYEGAFDRKEPFTLEYRLRRRDGEYRWVLDTGTPRFDADGTFLGYIGSCIDIGDRKQAELDHQLQSSELARVGRLALMGELAASLAHEVNNPLGAMVTNASAGQRLLAHGELGPQELQVLLADIVADGHRAREVIEGIRNMVRRSDTSHALVEIRLIIRDLLRIVRADAVMKKINLAAEIDSKSGSVMGDRVQLLQVLLNLTLNAFEALHVVRSDERRVVIYAPAAQDGKILVSVRDSGPGFPGGIVDRLFEPFFSTKAEGTGMGLAIARSIAEAHGGTLAAENCLGGGALFTLCLPEAQAVNSEAA